MDIPFNCSFSIALFLSHCELFDSVSISIFFVSLLVLIDFQMHFNSRHNKNCIEANKSNIENRETQTRIYCNQLSVMREHYKQCQRNVIFIFNYSQFEWHLYHFYWEFRISLAFDNCFITNCFCTERTADTYKKNKQNTYTHIEAKSVAYLLDAIWLLSIY